VHTGTAHGRCNSQSWRVSKLLASFLEPSSEYKTLYKFGRTTPEKARFINAEARRWQYPPNCTFLHQAHPVTRPATAGGSGYRLIVRCWSETLMKFRTFISTSSRSLPIRLAWRAGWACWRLRRLKHAPELRAEAGSQAQTHRQTDCRRDQCLRPQGLMRCNFQAARCRRRWCASSWRPADR